jgi:hypothetical protein
MNTLGTTATHRRSGGGDAAPEPQDVYARRVGRFFRWHPTLGEAQLAQPYFEVRAIAARHASVFRLTALIAGPDETLRLQIALRDDDEPQIREIVHERLTHELAPLGVTHG